MTQTVASQVKAANALLEAGEPGNISLDEHSGYTGYKPQSIVDAMNETFGIGAWGFEELSSEIVPGDKGGLAIAQVKVWLAGIDFQPAAWGQNRVTRGDIGDAKKGAQTDAIKKALSYFSIGNRAYHGLLHVEDKQQSNGNKASKQPAQQKSNQPINAPLPSELRAQAKELGKDFDAVVKFLFKKMIPDNELTPNDCQFIHVAFEKSAAIRKTAASASGK